MDPFLGEVRIFTWAWAPVGWALCNGAQMPIAQNAALNALLGPTYGGDSRTYFNLPDLRGRTPIHTGYGVTDGLAYQLGHAGGVEAVTLTTVNLPMHIHSVNALSGTKGNSATPKSSTPASVGLATGSTATMDIYGQVGSGAVVTLNPGSLSSEGGGGAHNNMQPFIVMNFCIATQGIFPPRQ